MQKLTFQDLKESTVTLSFNKIELLILSSLFGASVVELMEDNEEEYPQYSKRLEVCGDTLILALNGADLDTFPTDPNENAGQITDLMEKLTLSVVTALQQKS